MTSLGRSAVFGLVACAAALLIAPASASALRVPVGLPQAGATTVVVAQTRYRGKLPRHVKVRVKSPSQLPAFDRGLYAIYGKQRGRVAILTAYTILLRQVPQRGARASAFAESSGKVQSEGSKDFQFAFLAHALSGEKATYGKTREEEQARIISQVMNKQTPTEPPPKLEDMLKAGGVESLGIENPGNLGKSLIDTGHYDDGHAFDWKSAGTKAAIGHWTRLTEHGDPYGDVIDKIEADLTADLDRDGTVGPSGSSPGGSIGTEVGPPTIIRLP